MAGSIFGKLGRLCKILALTGITFELDGLRVDFKERRGLFSKTAGRRGIFESGPLDLVLAVWI